MFPPFQSYHQLNPCVSTSSRIYNLLISHGIEYNFCSSFTRPSRWGKQGCFSLQLGAIGKNGEAHLPHWCWASTEELVSIYFQLVHVENIHAKLVRLMFGYVFSTYYKKELVLIMKIMFNSCLKLVSYLIIILLILYD